jgi:hypothetical protein
MEWIVNHTNAPAVQPRSQLPAAARRPTALRAVNQSSLKGFRRNVMYAVDLCFEVLEMICKYTEVCQRKCSCRKEDAILDCEGYKEYVNRGIITKHDIEVYNYGYCDGLRYSVGSALGESE